MPVPEYRRQRIYTGTPAERVLLVAGDINRDGNDEILVAGRIGPEGMYWLERSSDGSWRHHLIDDAYPSLEAGGVLFDIDGDGQLDFLGGADYRGNWITWWQCPEDPRQRWTRRDVCTMPANQSHDQLIADVDADGRPELYFWNQGSRTLFVVPIPENPTVSPWPGLRAVAGGFPVREEGLATADIDGDGKLELLAGLSWYKCDVRGNYTRHPFAEGYVSPRLAAADFDGDGKIEIAMAEGDASFARPGFGRLVIFHQRANLDDLWDQAILHQELEDPHSIIAADFDNDGAIDLFVGELGDPQGKHKHAPAQRIYFNRGGKLVEQVIDEEVGTHEAKLVRLEGKLAIAGKPYWGLKSEVARTPDADAVHLWIPAT